MCDTQEHIKIGEKAFSWCLDILKSGRAGPGYAFINDLVARKYAQYPNGRPLMFVLTNDAQASYGDILAMAGDFYPEYARIFAEREAVQEELLETLRAGPGEAARQAVREAHSPASAPPG